MLWKAIYSRAHKYWVFTSIQNSTRILFIVSIIKCHPTERQMYVNLVVIYNRKHGYVDVYQYMHVPIYINAECIQNVEPEPTAHDRWHWMHNLSWPLGMKAHATVFTWLRCHALFNSIMLPYLDKRTCFPLTFSPSKSGLFDNVYNPIIRGADSLKK